MNDDLHSIDKEPIFREGNWESDPTENHHDPVGGPQEEIDDIRDAVENEPSNNAMRIGARPSRFAEWFARKRAATSMRASIGATILAGLLAGPFAVAGVVFSEHEGWFGFLYLVVFGPVAEEFLKQSGAIYLLERRPWHLFAPWQFMIIALLAALTFAVIENIIYMNLYTRGMGLAQRQAVLEYRWTVCVLVHVVCSLIASSGLVRVWRKQLAEARPADLSAAYPAFAAAMALHGAYNLVMLIFGEQIISH